MTWVNVSECKPLSDKGFSEVYEIFIGTGNRVTLLKYLHQFGFESIDKNQIGAEKVHWVYGVGSDLTP
ncbi:hypothetical protein KO519_16005 [Paraglaciecola agarilytica]|uniref:hypothetical protein n=1 Tax=Paraglaciecola chathamensis TaxID=368405 RepID=UPI001C08A351|nr:hypothetical protein [Paraglaciecola agarilytica]MBU3019185.1 hypothetical protein [Paraglaciecola agarilytica]